MATGPYHKWLGIPPEEQPASHYRLLGLEQFESDADVIETAAERQTLLLRTFQTGPDAELAERLLNEVATARVCLLNEKAKLNYDGLLKEKQTPEVIVLPSPSIVAADNRRYSKPTVWYKTPWAATGGGALIMLMLWPWGAKPSGSKTANTATAETKSLPSSLQQGLVAYYPFNGNAQGESGNGHDGVIYGARLAGDRHRQPQQAFTFRHGHYIELPPTVVEKQDSISLSVWCWPAFTNGPRWPRIIGGHQVGKISNNISICVAHRLKDNAKRLEFELQTDTKRTVT